MKLRIFLITLFALLLVPSLVWASKNKVIILEKDQVIEDAYYIRVGESIDVAGTVKGDVMVVGGNINIAGTVAGDVMVVGGNIRISGTVAGDVRVVGGTVDISSEIGGNVMAFGGNVILTDLSKVSGGIFVAAGNVELRGLVARQTRVYTRAATVAGEFGSDVEMTTGDDQRVQLNIYPSAVIQGNLNYTAPAEIVIPEQAQIRGEVIFHKLTHKDHRLAVKGVAGVLGVGWLFAKIISLFSLLAITLVLLALAPKAFAEVNDRAKKDPSKFMLKGLVWLILTPLASLLLAFTLIGLPLALIIMVVYLVAIYILKIFIGFMIGRHILQWLKIKQPQRFWVILLGLIVYLLIVSIPLVGWIFCLVMTVWIGGAMIDFKKHELKRYQ